MSLNLKSVLSVPIILGLGIGVFLLTTQVRVNEVRCSSQFGPCNLNLQNKLSKSQGKNIRMVKKEVKAILTTEVMIKNYSFQFLIPDKLLVNVIERKPKYALESRFQGKYAIVDEEGYVISIEESSNLPVAVKEGELAKVGEKVSQEEISALTLVNNLFNSYQIKEGTIEEETLTINYQGATRVIFPLEGDPGFLVSAFSLILKNFESSKSQPKVIDLRFKNPVISE